MINANWLPVPGLAVALVGLALLLLSLHVERDGASQSGRLRVAASGMTGGGLLALLAGVGIALAVQAS